MHELFHSLKENQQHSYVVRLTLLIIMGTFSTEALSKHAQRLMLPETTEEIIHRVDFTFSIKHTDIILHMKFSRVLCYSVLSGSLASKLE